MKYENPAALFAGIAAGYLRHQVAYPEAFMEQIAGLCPDGPVLDLGCGPGRLALALAARGRNVIAMDINDETLSAGRWEADNQCLIGQLQWVVGDAYDLTGVPSVAGATLADVFQWFDRAEVLRQLDRVVVPGGFVAVILSFATGSAKPWWYPLVDRVIHRRLGPGRFTSSAGLYRGPECSDHEAILRASPFNHLTVTRTDQSVHLDLEQVLAAQYTHAYASPPLLGALFDMIDQDLRALLFAAEPTGIFTATTQAELIIARRGVDQ